MYRILLLILPGFLAGCFLFVSPEPYHLTVNHSERLYFSGKGSGAGMMLMSAMGPMGIAIGVAIDEGIAKDIQQQAEQGSVAIDSIVQQQLLQEAEWLPFLNRSVVNIDRYGFISVPGDGDQVVPVLHVTIVSADNKTLASIQLPEKLAEDELSVLSTSSLEKVKSESVEIQRLWQSAAELLTTIIKSSTTP